MPFIAFDRTTRERVSVTAWHDPNPPHPDRAVLELAFVPDQRSERWDGATGVRPATAQELADYDAAHAPDTTIQDLIVVVADDAATMQEKADAKTRLLAQRTARAV